MFARSRLTIFEVLTMMVAAGAHARGHYLDTAIFLAAGVASVLIRAAIQPEDPSP